MAHRTDIKINRYPAAPKTGAKLVGAEGVILKYREFEPLLVAAQFLVLKVTK